MAERRGQKVKLLHIVDILRRYTDEEHPLNATEICEELAKRDVTAERKSIYDDINTLIDFGFDIIRTDSPKRGVFLGSRELEEPEVNLLCDAVRAASFISVKKSRELINKLEGILSVHKSRKRNLNIFVGNASRCDNEEIFYIIDCISDAIDNRHKITLKYIVRELGEDRSIKDRVKTMKVSPYAMTWYGDHYYLIGNYDKYDNLLHLRIDRMHSVRETDEAVRHFSEVCEYKDSFDVADYTNRLFGMFGGKAQEIEFKCAKSTLEQVLDRFGENIFIKKVTETHFSFTVSAAISEALVTWIVNYGKKLEVTSPECLKEMVKERAREVLEVYSDK